MTVTVVLLCIRYNMDVRIAQLEKMREQMQRRDGETEQEYKERTQAIGLSVSGSYWLMRRS